MLTITPEHRSQTPSSQHRLRRTPRLPATPSPEPARPEPRQPRPAPAVDQPQPVVTLGPRDQNVQANAQEKGKAARPRLHTRQLSQDLSSEDNEEEDSPISQRQKNVLDLADPESIFRISKRTHRAVLYTLEELLRGPFKLTPDLVEESASMADLLGGPSTSNGNVPSSSSRMPAARAPAGSPSSGIRGPRMIMQERAAREARQREERERLEREHAAEEARLLEEATQKEAERREIERRAAAGAGGVVPVGDTTHRRPARAGSRSGPDPSALYPDASRPTAHVAPQPSHRQTETLHGQPPAPEEAAGAPSQPHPEPGQTSDQLGATGRGRNSFPSAFERWETLSAHWEGLLSFWLRKLKQNADEINNDPVSKHLARNVEDLSSAGANLFHAVVELQRLRASSERKFQRWFFDTRTEIERHQEVTAMLEAALEKERQSRAEAVREALERERGNSRTEKQISELRKELQISKEEARRAWDELGRREQEERDRTASLQQGHPTIVGGVQVVPMTQGVSRHSSRRDQQPYASGEPEYGHTPSSRPEYGEAPAVQPVVSSSAAGPSYQAPATVHHQGSYGSEGTYSESEYTNFIRDSRVDGIPFRAPALDSDSDASIDEFETPGLPPTTQPPSSSGAEPQYTQIPDYSGAGYNQPGWEAGARHHHPTRLSDVLEEEEERSRTSASQSQVSRG